VEQPGVCFSTQQFPSSSGESPSQSAPQALASPTHAASQLSLQQKGSSAQTQLWIVGLLHPGVVVWWQQSVASELQGSPHSSLASATQMASQA
jgi:hypothetical protein